jgi:DNA-directed RNA polymerase specialized sigma24 family protein
LTHDASLLAAAAAAGDTHASEQFMHAHEAAVHRFLHVHVSESADVHDVRQETFIAAWRSAGPFAVALRHADGS